MNSFKTLFTLFCMSLFCGTIQAANIDDEAIERELKKKLLPVDYARIRSEYLKDQALIDAENTAPPEKEGLITKCLFNQNPNEGYDTPTESMVETEKRIKREESEYQAMLEVERKILKELKKFAHEHPSRSSELKALISSWRKKRELPRHRNIWPSDLAESMAQLLIENEDTAGAQKLLDLSLSSPAQAGDSQYLSSGLILVDYYNEIVAASSDTVPSSVLFSAVVTSISYFDRSSDSFEYALEIASSLKNARDMMVRWPLSPISLIKDLYYPEQSLLKIVYSRNFVDRLLKDVQNLNKIFKAVEFNGKIKDGKFQEGDLAGALYDAGFYGVWGHCGAYSQYIWVNPQGYIVRVKFNPNVPRWEYTVGLTLNNPLEWSQNNKKKAVGKIRCRTVPHAKGSGYSSEMLPADYLVTFAPNEVFKIAVEENGLVTIMPAFKFPFYWFNPELNMDSQLGKSHRELKNVGLKTKAGIDFSKIDSLCSF